MRFMLKNKKLIIVAVILIAAVLRFNQLNTLPALNADEAAIGYNVYSLIETGKDEHGNLWPVHFQSFNDYKPGLFFYIVLPFVYFLGLNEWAVRIPGALLGLGTVLLVYQLTVELVNRETARNRQQDYVHILGLIAAFLLAISPWHIHFSRGGWEVNAGTFFIVLGIWLALVSLRKGGKFWFLSFSSFVASLYTYHSTRIIVPLLALGFVFFFGKNLWHGRKKILLPAIIAILFLIPLAIDLIGPAGVARAGGVSIFIDKGVVERINEQRGEHASMGSLGALLFHNKLSNYSWEFVSNWGEHFWGQFLFLSGDDIERDKVPEIGLLYLIQLPFLMVGLFSIARNPRGLGIVVWWLAVAPFAAALTFQSPHALRSHNMIIPLTIISAFGLLAILNWIKNNFMNKNLRVVCYVLLVAVSVWDFTRYLHQYYVHMSKEYPFSSQYGVKELVAYVKDNYDKYPKFIITDRYDQPYILFLFYLGYPPSEFQKQHNLTLRDNFGFSTVRSFDKFEFRSINAEVLNMSKGALIAGSDKEIEDAMNVVHKIYFPDGGPAFKLVVN